MPVLISGSIAYDLVMSCRDSFGDHLLSSDLRRVNLTLLASDCQRHFGGCAGNIAYALRLLGGEPLVIGALGRDGEPYRQRWRELGVTDLTITAPDTLTAQGFIATDRDGAQLAVFSAGAMDRGHLAPFPEGRAIDLAIVAPDSHDSMWLRARQLAERHIPFFLDPGQALPLFRGEELRALLELADWAIASEYEAELLCRATGWDRAAVTARLRAFIVTRGAEGSRLYRPGLDPVDVPAERATVVDCVGAGDAFRGGLLHGLTRGFGLERAMRLGARIAALEVAVAGPQGYRLDFDPGEL